MTCRSGAPPAAMSSGASPGSALEQATAVAAPTTRSAIFDETTRIQSPSKQPPGQSHLPGPGLQRRLALGNKAGCVELRVFGLRDERDPDLLAPLPVANFDEEARRAPSGHDRVQAFQHRGCIETIRIRKTPAHELATIDLQ